MLLEGEKLQFSNVLYRHLMILLEDGELFPGCTKAALDMLGRTMALELGPHNVSARIIFIISFCDICLKVGPKI